MGPSQIQFGVGSGSAQRDSGSRTEQAISFFDSLRSLLVLLMHFITAIPILPAWSANNLHYSHLELKNSKSGETLHSFSIE